MCADAPWHLGWGRGLQAWTRPSLSQEPSRPCSTPGSASKLHLPGLGWDIGRMAHMTRVPAACPSARPDVQAGSRADRAGGPPRRRCRLVPPGAVPGAVPSAVSTRDRMDDRRMEGGGLVERVCCRTKHKLKAGDDQSHAAGCLSLSPRRERGGRAACRGPRPTPPLQGSPALGPRSWGP